MMKRWLTLLAVCLSPGAYALDWAFGEPAVITDVSLEPHFHHLDGAGRRHLAISGDQLALVWEDDRSGDPQVYLAGKTLDASHFEFEYQLSFGEEAFEPSVTAISGGRWLTAFEQDEKIVLRVVSASGAGPALQLSDSAGRQPVVASNAQGETALLWIENQGRKRTLKAVMVEFDDNRATLKAMVDVAPVEGYRAQGYPSAVVTDTGRLITVWEDRRAGHTRLFRSWRDGDAAFASAVQLNEHNQPDVTVDYLANKGTGVMRPTLAIAGNGDVQSVWMDKRSPGSGYAVWGTRIVGDGEEHQPNQIVQDELGASASQWHASVIANQNLTVAIWDDSRENWEDPDESGDIFISWKTGEGWSNDVLVPGASGEGYQGSPVAVLDNSDRLHLVWIGKDSLTSPSRLFYLIAYPH